MVHTPVETAVQERYSKAAERSEAALCCPVKNNPAYLRAIPSEVIEKDYGCGDPLQWLRAGETVLDLAGDERPFAATDEGSRLPVGHGAIGLLWGWEL